MTRIPAFTLRQLHYFRSVAECGKLRTAAEQLHISQATLSAALAQLEAELGVQLVLRQKARGVVLTAAGRTLLTYAVALLDAADALNEQATILDGSLSGSLTVGFYTALSAFHIPQIIRRLNAEHPQIALSFLEGSLDELENALRKGLCELAVIYGYRVDFDLHADLRVERLCSIYPKVIMSAEHRLAAHDTLSLEDLAEERFVYFDLTPARSSIDRIMNSRRLSPPIAYSTTNLELVRGLVAGNFGISVAYHTPAFDVSYDGRPIVSKLLMDATIAADVCIVTKGSILSSKAEAFQRFCRTYFQVHAAGIERVKP